MLTSNILSEALSLAENGGTSKRLGIRIGGKDIEPGHYVPRAEAQNTPEVAFSASNDPHIAICLDLDAPFQSFSFLGPILHLIQPGLKSSTSGEGYQAFSSGTTPSIADWVAPAPPPGSGPHRYVFLLYAQPADFDATRFAPSPGQKLPLSKRVRFDMDAFAREAKLGPMLAANFFTSN